MKNTILFILILGFLIRLVSINQSLWLDEATSALVARDLSFTQIVTEFVQRDFHPPLYYLVIKGWSELFGTGEIALRMVSVLFSLGTVYLIYLIGKRVKDAQTGTVAALLLAIAPLFVYYSQEARMYSMATFFVTLAVYLFAGIIKKKTKQGLIVFSLVLPLILLTDYLALLVLPVFWLYVFTQKRKLMKTLLLIHMPLLLVFVLIFPLFWSQVSSGMGVKSNYAGWWDILGKTSLKNTLLVPIKFMIGRISFYSKFAYGLVVFTIALLNGLLIAKVVKQKTYRLFVLWLVVPIALGLLIGFFVPVAVYFRFLFVIPAMYLLLAIALTSIDEKLFLPVFLLIVILNFSFTWTYLSTARFQREDWRGLTTFIRNESKDKETQILFVANSQMEGYRYYDPGAPLTALDGLQDDLDTVWLMRYVQTVFDPQDKVKQEIEARGYIKESEHSFNGIVVWRFNRGENKQ